MKKHVIVSIIICVFFSCVFIAGFSSCSKNSEEKTEISPLETASAVAAGPDLKLAALLNHTTDREPLYRWYYYSHNGILEIDTPNNVPQTIFRPWTECLRTAGLTNVGKFSFLLVNRLGLAELPRSLSEQPKLHTDALYFNDTTINNLVAVEDNPVFHVYRNSFFNNKASESPLPFLIQYRTKNDLFFPLLRVTDLELDEKLELVHLQYDGSAWTASFKSSIADRIEFNYIQFFSYEPLISLTGASKPEQIQKQILSQERFRQIVCNYEYQYAPERMKALLSQIPEELPLDINFTGTDNGTPLNYVRVSADDTVPFTGVVKDTGINIAALFSDGTVYFSGALDGTYILRNGKTVPFRLPKLPAGFLYTDFVLSGTVLYVAWEEELFFESSRAGFIAVDLQKVLYRDSFKSMEQ